ncbi:WYL domain-containing protein [Cohnella xylanilytica]|nr:WYL domain-containing protein [Cohnella xylanilytica]
MILSCGPYVTVLAPAFVADRIREMGERIARNDSAGENAGAQ